MWSNAIRVADDRKTLRVDISVEDQGTFNMPWYASINYAVGDPPGERPCADNNREAEAGLVPMAVNTKPEF